MDVELAFLLNALIYSLAHAPQGWRETLYALPFGILLCAITSLTGNFWAAYIIHVSLALSNDHFAIKNNPHMRFTPSFNFSWLSTRKTLR
jgi:membrane protease YdiL (CAAX protease family)